MVSSPSSSNFQVPLTLVIILKGFKPRTAQFRPKIVIVTKNDYAMLTGRSARMEGFWPLKMYFYVKPEIILGFLTAK